MARGTTVGVAEMRKMTDGELLSYTQALYSSAVAGWCTWAGFNRATKVLEARGLPFTAQERAY